MNYKFNKGTSDQSKYHHINDLQGWTSINDSIMGGKSFAKCTLLENGLQLEGNLIEPPKYLVKQTMSALLVSLAGSRNSPAGKR